MNRQKILIVDDSEINRSLLIAILEDQYEIDEAENGRVAVEKLAENYKEYSLLLLDINMPEMNGFDVLDKISKHHWNEDMAVIMISADESELNMKRAYDMGAFDYISRPFNRSIVEKRIENTMLLYARQQKLEEIIVKQFHEQEKNNRLMISILSHIVEFRNGESGKHVLNVSAITKRLLSHLFLMTDRYQLTAGEIKLICSASSLHDIGKITIPDAILNKPGRLTDEEFAIMKSHSVAGSDMLDSLSDEQKNTPLVKVAREICRWHHERFDGNGYPDHLKGDDIPISAQVVSIADVYDALTSERCYKKAFTHEKAIKMILNGECGAFNPLLLQCLSDISDELEADLSSTTLEDDESYSNDRIDFKSLLNDEQYT